MAGIFTELRGIPRRYLDVTIVVTCSACGWRYSVIAFYCGGFKQPRPGPCNRCGALGTRRWQWAAVFLDMVAAETGFWERPENKEPPE